MISLLITLAILFLTTSCSFFLPNPPCPPPPSARPPSTCTFSCTNPTVVPVVPASDQILPLADLLDVALLNSPKTRAAWYLAKQAATDVGTARGAFLPPVNFQAYWLEEQLPSLNLSTSSSLRFTLISALFSTSYLIFDFGGRNANLGAALAALASLNWAYNWEVQTVMINVIQSYYNYLNAYAIVQADEETVKDNLETVNAATAQRIAGAKSLADELQTRTLLVQSRIVLEQDKAVLDIAKATLVQALALPPDTPISVVELPEHIQVEGICQDMATLMQLAKERRADLKQARANIIQNRFQIISAWSQLLPTIDTQVQVGKQSLNYHAFDFAYSAQFNLNVPIFNSFADINNVRKTYAKLLENQANLDDEELDAFLAVLIDYYEILANAQILKHSRLYIDTATENQEVALANYKAGINTVIEVMTANNLLNIARKQLANAKTNFLTSIANLAYDTGGLDNFSFQNLGEAK